MNEIKKLKLDELNRLDDEAIKKVAKIPVVVVLDNIRSGLNVGSIFRTSDAFLVQKLYLCGITAKPPHKEILKTAIGANRTVNWSYEEDVNAVCNNLIEDGYTLIGIEQTNQSVELLDFKIDPGKKYAIVLGNEVAGINDKLLSKCDFCIEIPQFGTKHSLNVAVCGGIIIHHFAMPFLQVRN